MLLWSPIICIFLNVLANFIEKWGTNLSVNKGSVVFLLNYIILNFSLSLNFIFFPLLVPFMLLEFFLFCYLLVASIVKIEEKLDNFKFYEIISRPMKYIFVKFKRKYCRVIIKK